MRLRKILSVFLLRLQTCPFLNDDDLIIHHKSDLQSVCCLSVGWPDGPQLSGLLHFHVTGSLVKFSWDVSEPPEVKKLCHTQVRWRGTFRVTLGSYLKFRRGCLSISPFCMCCSSEAGDVRGEAEQVGWPVSNSEVSLHWEISELSFPQLQPQLCVPSHAHGWVGGGWWPTVQSHPAQDKCLLQPHGQIQVHLHHRHSKFYIIDVIWIDLWK